MKSLLSFGIAVLLVCSGFASVAFGKGREATAAIGPVEVLSDTMGVDSLPIWSACSRMSA
jgi:hypothetical protein